MLMLGMQNEARIHPDGYLEVTITGHQTYLTYDKLKQDLKPLLEQLHIKHKQILGFVDFSGLTDFDPSSIKGGFEVLESIPYKKVAFFGATPALTPIIESVIMAIGKGDKTKIFAEKAEALSWLMKS